MEHLATIADILQVYVTYQDIAAFLSLRSV